MAAGFVPERAHDDFRGIGEDAWAFLNGLAGGFTSMIKIDVVVDLKADPDADGTFFEGEIGDDGIGEKVVGVVDDDAVGIADAGTAEAEIDDISPGTPVAADGVDFNTVAYPDRTVGNEKNSGEDVGESFFGRHADGDARDSGAGEKGGDFDSVNSQGDEEGDEDEDEDVEALEKVNEAVIEIVVGLGGHFLHATQDEPRNDEMSDESGEKKESGLGPSTEVLNKIEHGLNAIVACAAWRRHFREARFRQSPVLSKGILPGCH